MKRQQQEGMEPSQAYWSINSAVIQMERPFALVSKIERERVVFLFFFFKVTIVLAECAPDEGSAVEACAWMPLDGEATLRAMK